MRVLLLFVVPEVGGLKTEVFFSLPLFSGQLGVYDTVGAINLEANL